MRLDKSFSAIIGRWWEVWCQSARKSSGWRSLYFMAASGAGFYGCTFLRFYLLDHFIKVRVRSPKLRVSSTCLQEVIPQCRPSSETLCIGCGWRWDAVEKNSGFKLQSIPSLQFCSCTQNKLQLRDSASDWETRATEGFPARLAWQSSLGLLISSAAWYVSCIGIRWECLIYSLLALCHVLPLPLTSSDSVLWTD